MKATVSVLTASLPDRAEMLAEAKASVSEQDLPRSVQVEHIVAIDHDREGAGVLLNRCLALSSGDWVMVLDDDDLLDPDHLATVLAHPLGGVVYTLPRVTGGTFAQYHGDFDGEHLLRGHNMVSHNALLPRRLVKMLGGWNPVTAFDLDLFQRLHQAGVEFHQIRETTWTYRLHGSNLSQGTLTPW